MNNNTEKSDQIHIRVTPDEKDKIKTLAHEHRMTMSEFLMFLIDKQSENTGDKNGSNGNAK